MTTFTKDGQMSSTSFFPVSYADYMKRRHKIAQALTPFVTQQLEASEDDFYELDMTDKDLYLRLLSNQLEALMERVEFVQQIANADFPTYFDSTQPKAKS